MCLMTRIIPCKPVLHQPQTEPSCHKCFAHWICCPSQTDYTLYRIHIFIIIKKTYYKTILQRRKPEYIQSDGENIIYLLNSVLFALHIFNSLPNVGVYNVKSEYERKFNIFKGVNDILNNFSRHNYDTYKLNLDINKNKRWFFFNKFLLCSPDQKKLEKSELLKHKKTGWSKKKKYLRKVRMCCLCYLLFENISIKII